MKPPALVDVARDWPGYPRWARPLAGLAERALALDAVNALYDRLAGEGGDPGAFCARALEQLGVSATVEPPGLERLRGVSGPCVVVANHPLGGRDALLMASALASTRREWRLLANSVLGRVRPLRPHLLLVDPFGGAAAAQRNRTALREAVRWLRNGGLLGVFPSGEVSLWREDEGRVADKEWAPQAFRMAVSTRATLVPMHLSGSSSDWLRILGWVHPALKTPFLARELMHGPARRLVARVGQPIASQDLPRGGWGAEAAAWTRERVYALADGRCA